MGSSKSFIKSLLIGIGIGLSINSTFLFIFSMKYESLNSGIIFKSYIASIILGVVSCLTGYLFNRMESMIKASIIHFLILITTFVSVALFAGWIEDISSVVIPAIEFTVIYVAIFLVIYFVEKRKIEKINEELRKKVNA